MKSLILMPGITNLEYALYSGYGEAPVYSGMIRPYRGEELSVLSRIFKEADIALKTVGYFKPDLVALRSPFGGELFPKPVRAGKAVINQLRAISNMAPLHIPPLIALVETFLEKWPDLPCILVFESSFFVNLPARERTYALGSDVSGKGGLRRFGYHGLYHAAAVHAAGRALFPQIKRRKMRALSFCLEPRPEMTAVANGRPLMTTSGLTPVEGLPGHGLCGEIDPSIVIMLNEKKKWGPERINQLLTEESGLRGLTSEEVTLKKVFEDKKYVSARQVIEYRFLLSAGAGLAALGGLDMIVYSGRYAKLGQKLGLNLAEKIARAGGDRRGYCPVYIFEKPLSRIIADLAMITATD